MLTFLEWLKEGAKIYDIRLDPEDVKGGITHRDLPRGTGALEAWKNAWNSTKKRILANYPPKLKKAALDIEKNLLKFRPEAKCIRCGGSGIRNDYEDWILYPQGKVCYKCEGTGIEPKFEPVFRRRFTIDHIISKINQGQFESLIQWAKKVKKATIAEQPYKPILNDIVQLITKKQFDKIKSLPH